MSSPALKKAQRQLFWFGLLKIPIIGFVRPKIIELTNERLVLKIRLKRRTRNHVGSLYMAVFAIGADLSAGFLAYYLSGQSRLKVAPVFKNFSIEYLKRAESDTYFVCEAGSQISQMLQESSKSEERVTQDVSIKMYVNYPDDPELVADSSIGLSLKVKG